LKKSAFITGVTGQDGSLLAAFLLARGYEVHGLVRWDAVDTTQRLRELQVSQNLQLHYGDMLDAQNLTRLIQTIRPDEIYNLAALSHVKVSFETPSSALDINAKGTLHLLEAVRLAGLEQETRIYQASSSEMFGFAVPPQDEDTRFEPCSPYGVSKLAGYWLARTYRDGYGMHVSNGILFNHESPLRGEDFVTRKITRAVAAIEAGQQDKLVLGNLDSMRDWGHAADYIEGMWLMQQQDRPDDYVLATGEARSVREFVQRAFEQIGVILEWEGDGLDEVAKDAKTGKVLVSIDEQFYRPNEVNYLCGDAAKARAKLGWRPKVSFDELVSEMVNADRRALREEGRPWKKMAG
jgi:GDPmannose 4,6-dehydratase